MTLRFYRDCDADPAALAGHRVAVVGFGTLGRSVALNLRDSGLSVIIGNIADAYRDQAIADGFTPVPIATAVAQADDILVLLPDAVIAGCFAREIVPCLRPGNAVCFASGYALAFGLITPPPDVDVLVLAPRMPGRLVRRAYLDGTGFISCLSVAADASGQARARLLGLAQAAGSLRRGAFELPAASEALLDLLVEQTVGVYLGLGIQLAFRIGLEAGLPAEALVLELYMSGEMARTMDAFADEGLSRSVGCHSLTALYGGFTRTTEVDNAGLERMFRATLRDISSGGFARRYQDEVAAGAPVLTAIRELLDRPSPMSDAEANVRKALGFASEPEWEGRP
jgi:ketol-acid reductoisomerase